MMESVFAKNAKRITTLRVRMIPLKVKSSCTLRLSFALLPISKVLLAKIIDAISRIPHSDVNRLLAVREENVEVNWRLDKFFLSIITRLLNHLSKMERIISRGKDVSVNGYFVPTEVFVIVVFDLSIFPFI